MATGLYNSEDTQLLQGGRVASVEEIERVRRAHLNDVESIYIFFINAFLYLTTGPGLWMATTLFKVFTVSRYLHTIVYLSGVSNNSSICKFISKEHQ